MAYKNHKGYSDPTAGQAMSKVMLKEWINWIKHVSERMNTILVEGDDKR